MIYFKPMTEQSEWNWIRQQCHQIQCEDSQGIVGYSPDGEIKCAAVFDSFTVDGCSMHLACPGIAPLRHGLLREIAHHLFNTCRRERVFCLVPTTNTKSEKFSAHVGFKEVARIPDAIASGVGYIVFRMDKADCRWLAEEFRRAA